MARANRRKRKTLPIFEAEETDRGRESIEIEEEIDVKDFLTSLPDEFRELLEYLEAGFSHAEIAKKMRCGECRIQKDLRAIRARAFENFF